MSLELKPVRVALVDQSTNETFVSDVIFVPALIPLHVMGQRAQKGVDDTVAKNAAAYRRRMDKEAADRRDEERLQENYPVGSRHG